MVGNMKIPVVYAWRNLGCGPEYTLRALARMGYETKPMLPDEYFSSKPDDYDWYFCQDSSNGIDFSKASPAHLKKSSYWDQSSRGKPPPPALVAGNITSRG